MRPPHACRWLMTKGWFFWPLAPGARPVVVAEVPVVPY